MARIVPKLNLNKTPHLVQNNSLVFAKNIQLATSGNIVRDSGISIPFDAHSLLLAGYNNNIAKLDAKLNEYYNIIDGLYYNSSDSYDNILKKYYGLELMSLVSSKSYSDLGPNGIFNSDKKTLTYLYGYNTTFDEPQSDIIDEAEDSKMLSPTIDNCLIQDYTTFKSTIPGGEFLFPVFDYKVFILLRDGYTNYNQDSNPFLNINYEAFLDAVDYIKENNPELYEEKFVDFRDVEEDGQIVFTIKKQYTDGYYEIVEDETPVYEDYSDFTFYEQFYLRYLEDFLIRYNEFFNAAYNKSVLIATAESKDVDYKLSYYRKLIDDLQYEKSDYSIYESYLEEYSSFNIVGVIPYNTKFYVFYSSNDKSFIAEYDELANTFKPLATNWNWSGGKIKGVCVVSLRNEIVLNICEYGLDDILIPFKSINLSNSKHSDSESLYTQLPNIPLYNLNFKGYNSNAIPKGIYQFFIRYKIRENQYTNWFLASKQLYTGEIRTNNTIQGDIRYVDDLENSSHSFTFDVEEVNSHSCDYESFQIGFIRSGDNQTVARSWKHFPMNTRTIDFDADLNYIDPIDITDLLNNSFSLYNVENIEIYKTRLYASNYRETDFNPELNNYAKLINIDINTRELSVGSSTAQTTYTVNGVKYVAEFDPNNTTNIIGWSKDSTTINYKNKVRSHLFDKLKLLVREDDPMGTYYTTVDDFGFTYKYNKYRGTKVVTKPYTTSENFYLDYIKVPSDFAVPNGHNAYIIIEVGDKLTYYDIGGAYSRDGQGSLYYGNLDEGLLNDLLDDIIDNYNSFNLTINNPVGGNGYGNLKLHFIHTLTGTRGSYSSLEVAYNKVNIDFKIDASNFNRGTSIPDNSYSFMNLSTLIPGQSYKFYIHYVRANGEITNGYLIDEISIDESLIYNGVKIYYPSFSNIVVPSDYVSAFISIQHTRNKIIHLIHNGETETQGTYKGFSSLEIDSGIFPSHQNLNLVLYRNRSTKVKQSVSYYSSSNYDSEHKSTFGNNGIILCTNSSTDIGILQQQYNNDFEEPKLIKCTPYISFNGEDSFGYDNYEQMDLLGFICLIQKPSWNNLYVSGNDAYTKDNNLQLTKATIQDISQQAVGGYNKIFSNYNLNLLTLREEPNAMILNIEGTGDASINGMIYTAFNSLTLSDVYKFDGIYVDYNKKTFSKFSNKNNVTKFDNTIRRSENIQDEDKNIIYKFDNLEYYNVPTHKGIISNLVVLGDALIVHTYDSAFIFKGSNIIKGSSTDIQQKESDIFDTGCSELFGSKYGFGGLQNSSLSIVTPNVYCYYDSHNNKIFAIDPDYSIRELSDDIKLLMNVFKDDLSYNVNSVYFSYDVENDKIYMSTHYENGERFTISYHVLAKAFISLHDFDYNKSFNTKLHTYFIKNDIIYKLSNKYIGYDDLTIREDYLYPIYLKNIVHNSIRPRRARPIGFKEARPIAIVDVIFNVDYENIKTLQYIRWSSSDAVDFGYPADTKNYAEEFRDLYAGDFVRLYTDSCYSDLIDVKIIQNGIRLYDIDTGEIVNNEAAYKFPRYNQGMYNLNYFRDIKNTNDIYKYQTDTNGEEAPQKYRLASTMQSDNNSLIYGKYIVARFILDTSRDFRLETVYFDVKL